MKSSLRDKNKRYELKIFNSTRLLNLDVLIIITQEIIKQRPFRIENLINWFIFDKYIYHLFAGHNDNNWIRVEYIIQYIKEYRYTFNKTYIKFDSRQFPIASAKKYYKYDLLSLSERKLYDISKTTTNKISKSSIINEIEEDKNIKHLKNESIKYIKKIIDKYLMNIILVNNDDNNNKKNKLQSGYKSSNISSSMSALDFLFHDYHNEMYWAIAGGFALEVYNKQYISHDIDIFHFNTELPNIIANDEGYGINISDISLKLSNNRVINVNPGALNKNLFKTIKRHYGKYYPFSNIISKIYIPGGDDDNYYNDIDDNDKNNTNNLKPYQFIFCNNNMDDIYINDIDQFSPYKLNNKNNINDSKFVYINNNYESELKVTKSIFNRFDMANSCFLLRVVQDRNTHYKVVKIFSTPLALYSVQNNLIIALDNNPNPLHIFNYRIDHYIKKGFVFDINRSFDMINLHNPTTIHEINYTMYLEEECKKLYEIEKNNEKEDDKNNKPQYNNDINEKNNEEYVKISIEGYLFNKEPICPIYYENWKWLARLKERNEYMKNRIK